MMQSPKANISPPSYKPMGRGERIVLVISLLFCYVFGIIPAAIVGILVAQVGFGYGEPAYVMGAFVTVPAWLIAAPVLTVLVRALWARKNAETNKKSKETEGTVP